jgi:ketosteroid isomerase-like protein
MIEPIPRSVVEAFHQAYSVRDAAKVAEFLADDVKWTISGPVDVLRFCGTRYGKAAVIDMIERLAPQVFRIQNFVREALLVDGDRAATLNRLTAARDDGRMVSYRVAQFLRFRDGKVIEYLSVIDSFDAVEQVLGHPLDVHELHDPQATALGDLIAV